VNLWSVRTPLTTTLNSRGTCGVCVCVDSRLCVCVDLIDRRRSGRQHRACAVRHDRDPGGLHRRRRRRRHCAVRSSTSQPPPRAVNAFSSLSVLRAAPSTGIFPASVPGQGVVMSKNTEWIIGREPLKRVCGVQGWSSLKQTAFWCLYKRFLLKNLIKSLKLDSYQLTTAPYSWICINARNTLWQKWGGNVHPSPLRGDAPVQCSDAG